MHQNNEEIKNLDKEFELWLWSTGIRNKKKQAPWLEDYIERRDKALISSYSSHLQSVVEDKLRVYAKVNDPSYALESFDSRRYAHKEVDYAPSTMELRGRILELDWLRHKLSEATLQQLPANQDK